MFFEDWAGLGRAAVTGMTAYIGLIFLLRLFGKRTLSKLNAFDLVVTVALGSILATALLSKDIPLLEGLTGFTVLALLQLIVTWLSVRSAAIRRLVRSEPALLYYRGEFRHGTLRTERVTENEVYQAVRTSGRGGLEQVEAVVLESDGTMSVIASGTGSGSALKGVSGVESGG